MNRSTITDPRLNAPFRKGLGEAFQVCPRRKVFTDAQVIAVLIFSLIVLGVLGVGFGGVVG